MAQRARDNICRPEEQQRRPEIFSFAGETQGSRHRIRGAARRPAKYRSQREWRAGWSTFRSCLLRERKHCAEWLQVRPTPALDCRPPRRFPGVVEAPVGIGLRIYVSGRVGIAAHVGRALRGWIGFGSDGSGLQGARIGSGAHLAVILIAAHDVAEGEENSGEEQHQHEQANDVLALEHSLAGPPASTSRCHSYFFCPANDCTQLLIISMGRGNTMVVFFSTPISVRVWR